MKTFVALCALLAIVTTPAQTTNADPYAFVNAETERIEKQNFKGFQTAEDRAQRLREAHEMFGLSPMPARGDLHATVTGRLEDDTVAVEKIHFQSSPGLYVTANLYLPKTITKPIPAVLYVCGHTPVITNGVSYGNKTAYGHHGAWFARNGYACLVMDTVQLGEIPGLHHGTYREGMWWWNSRGYSSAAVEAWNGIRALDYLETRPEIDKTRFGITGRSGGGAYSWSAIALDLRIKVSAPVAGITDLRNHVIDGTVEGHCDCMFFVNTYAWDYHMLAGCAAPRPLLIVNTDQDSIFPLDGVVRLHKKAFDFYRVLGATDKIGLVIAPGPHKDTQDLQIPVFRWFNHFLRGSDTLIDLPATNHFTATQLRVFDQLPADQRNSTVQEWFVPKAPAAPPIATREEWSQQREQWMNGLSEKVFRNWPRIPQQKQPDLLHKEGAAYRVAASPRPTDGLNPTAAKHLRRRYMLVGHTIDSMRVFDLVNALNALPEKEITLAAEGDMAVNALFASLFSDKVKTLQLKNLPSTLDKSGATPETYAPDYLNILRVLDIREALALQLERSSIELENFKADTAYAASIAKKLNWQTVIR
jgi:dienelactone hydrolase